MLNKLLCFAGWHEYAFRFDAGIESPICKTEFGVMFYSDDKVKCCRCGKVVDANWNKHKHLPEILFKQ